MDDRNIILLPGEVPFEPPESQQCFVGMLERTPKHIAVDMLTPALPAGFGTGLLGDRHGNVAVPLFPERLGDLFQPEDHGRITLDNRHTGCTEHPARRCGIALETEQVGLLVRDQSPGFVHGEELQLLNRLRGTDLPFKMGKRRQMNQRRDLLSCRFGSCRHCYGCSTN